MDCAEFEKIVHDLDRRGTEGFAVRESALAHAESCNTCARLMTDAESLDGALDLLVRSESGRNVSAGLEAVLLGEFRRQSAAAARRRVQLQIAALGAAAVLVLAFGVSLRHRLERTSALEPRTNSAATTLSPGAERPTTALGGSEQREDISAYQSGDSEYATAFISLPYADDPGALADGTVVRVEMSRAALATFGLPVSAVENDDIVRADLIVSADGTPQAIRLVSPDGGDRTF